MFHPNVVLEKYSVDVKSIKKIDKEILIKTKNRELSLKKIKLIPSEIIFIYSAQRHLIENKFYYFEKLMVTKDGSPYVKFKKDTYILIRKIEGKKLLLENNTIIKCIDFVNSFHAASSNLNAEMGTKYKAKYGVDVIRARNILSVLCKIKENPETIKNSNISEKLMKYIDRQILYAQTAYDIIKQPEYINISQHAMLEKRFIHGKLEFDNIVEFDNRLFLKNMLDVNMNIREKDIACFIKSILKKDKSLDYLDILNAFYKDTKNNYRKRLILALVLMPEEFYSILKKMLKTEQEWAINQLIEKIEKINKRFEFRDKILASLALIKH